MTTSGEIAEIVSRLQGSMPTYAEKENAVAEPSFGRVGVSDAALGVSNFAVRFVDRPEQLAEAWRLVDWVDAGETSTQHL